MAGKTRRIYSEQFKADAIKLVLASGRAVRQVARELDLDPGSLHTWMRQRRKRAGDVIEAQPASETLEEEVRRLRRDLANVKEERDFLKKATAYFAKESK